MSMQIGCSFAYLFEDVSIVDNTIRTSAKQQPLQHPVPIPALGYWKSASGCAADDVRSWQAPCDAGFCFCFFQVIQTYLHPLPPQIWIWKQELSNDDNYFIVDGSKELITTFHLCPFQS